MESSYDYIVCGAGSAGCVVASRLSEDSNTTVLLLEAGPNDDVEPRIQIPGQVASLRKTKIDWNYKTEPQAHAYQGYKDHVATWSRGKVLGGSSSINYMAYGRCHSEDYEGWEKMGAEGWSWMDVFPYFLKSENNTIPKYACEMDHFMGGPMTVSLPEFRTPLSQTFLDAGEELGYEVIDINNGLNIGFGDVPATINEDGERCSASKAFLNSASDRTNLTILTDAFVTKIDIEGKSAFGVRFLLNGEEKIIAANKEVIISCGVVGSPKILMLSGIGPKQHLEELGIKCVADLPVGQNLQDHLGVQMKATVKSGSGVITHEAMQMKANNMRLSNIMEATAFIQTSLKEPEAEWPDIQVNFMGTIYPYGIDEPDLHVLKSPKFSPLMGYDTSREARMRKEGVAFIPTLLHPKSKGEIRLRNKDPKSPPIIDPHYLENPDDIRILAEGIRFVKRLIETKAMKQHGVQLLDLKISGSKHDTWSDENLEQYIRHFASTQSNAAGTCKMGAAGDKTAVVDPHLRVRGIGGLRVIDASIIPSILSGNTNTPCFMIGEKATDIIKEDEAILETVPIETPKESTSSSSSSSSLNFLNIPGHDSTLLLAMSSSPDLLHKRPRSRSSPKPSPSFFAPIVE